MYDYVFVANIVNYLLLTSRYVNGLRMYEWIENGFHNKSSVNISHHILNFMQFTTILFGLWSYLWIWFAMVCVIIKNIQRSRKHRGKVGANPLFMFLCMLLSNDIPLNPEPTVTYTYMYYENNSKTDVDLLEMKILNGFMILVITKTWQKYPKGTKFTYVDTCGLNLNWIKR